MEACLCLPPDESLPLVTALVKSALEGNTSSRPGIPILISGSLIEDMRIFDAVEKAGGRTAADDLCTGWRNFCPPAGPHPDRSTHRPLSAHSRAQPGRSSGRAPILFRGLLERSGARGVVFLLQKFCTPHLADHPILVRALKERGIPSSSSRWKRPASWKASSGRDWRVSSK